MGAGLQELSLLHSLSFVMLIQPCFPQQIYSLQLQLLAEVIKRVDCVLQKLSLSSPWCLTSMPLCHSLVSYWAYNCSLTSYIKEQEIVCLKAFQPNPAQPSNCFFSARFKSLCLVYEAERQTSLHSHTRTSPLLTLVCSYPVSSEPPLFSGWFQCTRRGRRSLSTSKA